MGRFNNAASYGHKIRRNPWGEYRVSWVIGFYYSSLFYSSGSRMRQPRAFSRDVDDLGAARFCKKWSVTVPDATRSDIDKKENRNA